MDPQEKKDLEYLRHVIINGTVCLCSMLKQIEIQLQTMTDAVKIFESTWQKKGNEK